MKKIKIDYIKKNNKIEKIKTINKLKELRKIILKIQAKNYNIIKIDII